MSAKPQRRHVQIAITENCNLDCVYCYEKKKDRSVMPADKIKAIITEVFANSDGFDEIEFTFHGGEIALVFNRLREVCEWMWSRQWDKPYICFACTNGTLIHGKIQNWFRANAKRFCLGVSLDGTRQMHDANRSGSYDKIDIEFFTKTWPKQGTKMTISPQSLPDLTAGVIHLHSLGVSPIAANLAYGVDWSPTLLPAYARELKKLADFYLTHPTLTVTSLLTMPLRTIGYLALFPEKREPKSHCGSGTSMICYGCDGAAYPCQAFMPSTNAKDGAAVMKKIDFNDANSYADPECAKCPLDSACPTCHGHNYMATGTLYKRPKDLCRFRKVEALASSYLYGKMLQNRKKYPVLNDLSDFNLRVTAMGVAAVQKTCGGENGNS